jgi:ubiquinone/menaquinone biosynthesis C-methylase UbiE
LSTSAVGTVDRAFWLARQTGAAVVGIDVSAVAIANAPDRARAFGVQDRVQFRAADITATGLSNASCDGATSIDMLWSVLDKAAAVRECARILKPGARFVFTNWDKELIPPNARELGLEPLDDHRPLLEDGGFAVEQYEIQANAEERRRAFYERVVAAETEIEQEMGVEGAQKLLSEAKANLGLVDGVDYLTHSRGILVVAQRR